jgi:SHS2 domain-containing protein
MSLIFCFIKQTMAKGTADAHTVSGTYELIDHTADVGILVNGATCEELFARGAAALFDLMVNLDKVKSTETLDIELQADSLEDLFVAWLNELLFQAEAKEMFFSRFEVSSVTNRSLKASVMGERYKEDIHVLDMQVKAATYHQLNVSPSDDGWTARVIFDV